MRELGNCSAEEGGWGAGAEATDVPLDMRGTKSFERKQGQERKEKKRKEQGQGQGQNTHHMR